MRAFIASLIVLAVITVAAALGLGAVDMSSGTVFSSQTGDVRL
jgi:hypothetical protein